MEEITLPGPVLDRQGWELVAELLERESRCLLTEMRHTSAREFRELLSARLRRVEALLSRIQPVREELKPCA
jgi:hypothetical protein